MKDTVTAMKATVRRFMRGQLTIGECELALNDLISEATMDFSDLNVRLRNIRILKRKAWRMMLDATK